MVYDIIEIIDNKFAFLTHEVIQSSVRRNEISPVGLDDQKIRIHQANISRENFEEDVILNAINKKANDYIDFGREILKDDYNLILEIRDESKNSVPKDVSLDLKRINISRLKEYEDTVVRLIVKLIALDINYTKEVYDIIKVTKEENTNEGFNYINDGYYNLVKKTHLQKIESLSKIDVIPLKLQNKNRSYYNLMETFDNIHEHETPFKYTNNYESFIYKENGKDIPLSASLLISKSTKENQKEIEEAIKIKTL